MINVAPHPLLRVHVFETVFPQPMEFCEIPAHIQASISGGQAGQVPGTPLFSIDDDHRKYIRDMLRAGGFKPSGRSKPACEYLERAVADGILASINLAVDMCNVVSLFSGFPISVVDADLTCGELSIRQATSGESYVFNSVGQTIELSGLVCLYDQMGACANAVKDCQRTKTNSGTLRTISVIWSAHALEEKSRQAADWYASMLADLGCELNWIEVTYNNP
ncbi:MAG: hypothetical protein KDB03_03380 [Planctomycetales bacterium]|nr:hypothetical protein [Planctomycetales bacterium]